MSSDMGLFIRHEKSTIVILKRKNNRLLRCKGRKCCLRGTAGAFVQEVPFCVEQYGKFKDTIRKLQKIKMVV